MTYQELERVADEAAGELREAARRWYEAGDWFNRLSSHHRLLDAAERYGEAWEAQQAAYRDGLRHTLQPWITRCQP